jgi:hypothetical protein
MDCVILSSPDPTISYRQQSDRYFLVKSLSLLFLPIFKEEKTMRMSMNEKKALYAFGCPNREATVERLRFAAALAPDPAAKKLFFTLAVKLSDENCDKWYRCFFYNMRLEVEHFAHHKYHSDNQPISIRERLHE